MGRICFKQAQKALWLNTHKDLLKLQEEESIICDETARNNLLWTSADQCN